MKISFWIAGALLMASITVLSFSEKWCRFLAIDKSGMLVEETHLEERRNGLTGFCVRQIDADPKHPGHVVIRNGDFAYVAYASSNHGASWHRIKGFHHMYVWVDKILVGIRLSKLFYSVDFGRNWSPIEMNTTDHVDDLYLLRDSQGQAWVSHRKKPSEYYYRLIRTDRGVKLGPGQSFKVEDEAFRTRIQVMGGEQSALVVMAADGDWAATERGPFFRAAGNEIWEERTGDLSLPAIDEIVPSPVDPNVCLARGLGGRLWTTKDRGKQWELVTPRHVAKAAFLADGSLLVAQSDHKILLFRQGRPTDISPPGDYFQTNAQRQIEQNLPPAPKDRDRSSRSEPFDPNGFCFHAIGGTSQYQWIVGSDSPPHLEYNAVEISFSNTLKEIRNPYHWKNDMVDRLFLFVHTPGQGWQTKIIDEFYRYEPITRDPCKLTVDISDLYIGGEAVATEFLDGSIDRAGWLQDKSLYYAMSGDRVQVGKVRNCRPTRRARSWNLKGGYVSIKSQVFEIPGGFEVLWPHEGFSVEAFRIELNHPPIWRLIMQRLSFGPSVALAWGLIVIWGWMIRLRNRRAALAVDKKH